LEAYKAEKQYPEAKKWAQIKRPFLFHGGEAVCKQTQAAGKVFTKISHLAGNRDIT
jgi:hypothetical protein